MHLGTAKIDITPTFPVPLAGFADRQKFGPASEASQRLYARVFLFRPEDRRSSDSLLVSADLIWWGSERVPRLKERLAALYGIAEEHILLHATHTHSGPQPSERFTAPLGICDPVYVQWLEDRVVQGVSTALAQMEPIRIEKGTGQCRIGINRRVRTEDGTELSPNDDGVSDPELNVIAFRRPDQSVKAVLVHYACHPVITRENRFSSEFCGVAMERVEQAIGSDVLAAYLQGCCGDINPGRNGAFSFGTDELVRQVGEELGRETLEVLSRPMADVPADRITARRMTAMLPLQPLPDPEQLRLWSAEETDIRGEWSRLLLAQPERLVSSLPLDLTYWHVAGGLSFLTLNCETVVEYGLTLKEHYRGRVLPLGYSNGMLGYLPTAKQLEEGGYEPYGSTFYFAMPAPFHPDAEQEAYRSIRRLIDGEGSQ